MNNENNIWLKEYIDLMLNGNDEKAMTLKLNHFPKSFYKYRALNENTFKILKDDLVWLADIETLNDPFDENNFLRGNFSDPEFPNQFKTTFGKNITPHEINEIINSSDPYTIYSNICKTKGVILNVSRKNLSEKTNIIWHENRNEEKKLIRICSFSECNDSLLMWAHYSNEHKGICIEYDFNDSAEIRPFLQPVFYSNIMLKINSSLQMDTINNVMASICKAEDWNYEKEWRLTFFTKKQIDKNENHANVPIPKAIYLGARFHLNSNLEKTELEQIAKERNIPVYNMEKHQSEYKIVVKQN
jgi:hypothetical protein